LKSPNALTLRVALLLTVPPLMWAGNAVVGRLMVGQVPPLTLNFLRWSLTALFLLAIAWRGLRPWPRTVQQVHARWPYLLATGLLGVGFFNALQYAAVVTSTPINVTLVGASLPVWMLAVGALFFAEKPRPRQLLGAALGLVGVLLVIGRGSWASLVQVQFVQGDLLMLLAIIGWAFYSWLLARPPASMQGDQRPAWDWAGFLLVQTLFGLLAASAFSAAEQVWGTYAVRWSPGVVAALLYVSVGASILAYRCWGLGVAAGGPALAGFFNNLTPLFAALLSALILGDAPQGYHAVAFVLIAGGIVVSAPRRAKSKAPPQNVPG
jgi:drug/metabolite transporter (DMT)-like permease